MPLKLRQEWNLGCFFCCPKLTSPDTRKGHKGNTASKYILGCGSLASAQPSLYYQHRGTPNQANPQKASTHFNILKILTPTCLPTHERY